MDHNIWPLAGRIGNIHRLARCSSLIFCQQCPSFPPHCSLGTKPVEKRLTCWMEALSLGALKAVQEEWLNLQELTGTWEFKAR